MFLLVKRKVVFFISLAFKSTVVNRDYNKINNKTSMTDHVDVGCHFLKAVRYR